MVGAGQLRKPALASVAGRYRIGEHLPNPPPPHAS
jgi:hypothetical protein